jgi:hypothetical protein
MQASVLICIIGPVGSGEVEVRRYVTSIWNASAKSLIARLSAYTLIVQGDQQAPHGLYTILQDILKPKNPCAAMEEQISVSIPLYLHLAI